MGASARPSACRPDRNPYACTVRPFLVLALATCTAVARPVLAQSSPPAPTEADSAAVLSLAVEELLKADSASDPIKPGDPANLGQWKDPEAHLAEHLPVFVRIGEMPFGAWAKPSIARLHEWRWRLNGWATDSIRIQREFTALPGRSYEVTLSLRIAFEGNLAAVEESWDPLNCELGFMGSRPISVTGRVMVRSLSGWRYDEGLSSGGVTDGPCSRGGLHAGGASSP
jgi:hypothetical protein